MTLPDGTLSYVAHLVEGFPIRDVWVLRTADATGCYAGAPNLLIATVPDDAEPWKIEDAIRAQADPQFEVHLFPESAVYQTPRPLLLKMAFASGVNVRTA
jgi:hypothetical protein